MVELSDILLFSLLSALIYYWWSSQGIKQVALEAAKSYCQEKELQLLDESMVLSRLWYNRNDKGRLQLSRRFNFEFTSTGEQRYRGEISMLGRRVTGGVLDAYRI